MFQIKIAATLIVLLALFNSVSFAQGQQSDSLVKLFSPPQFNLPQPTSNDIAFAFSPEPPTAESSSTSGYVRTVPTPPPAKEKSATRPFHSIAIGFTASTSGAGIEIATPVSRSFNLRSSFNTFAFNYPFTIDGVYYNSRLHLQSYGTTLDWFPLHSGFHISPGILYVKNTLSAPATVGVGQPFELGNQPFINSEDDPVTGTSSVVVPRKFAPMLLFGFSNIIPRTGRHFSIPIEFGAAYTGAPQINVALDGTACTTQGCVAFATNAEAQVALKQEVYNLNEDLKRVPFFPILSIGLACHF
jgi:hypothetical protein